MQNLPAQRQPDQTADQASIEYKSAAHQHVQIFRIRDPREIDLLPRYDKVQNLRPDHGSKSDKTCNLYKTVKVQPVSFHKYISEQHGSRDSKHDEETVPRNHNRADLKPRPHIIPESRSIPHMPRTR